MTDTNITQKADDKVIDRIRKLFAMSNDTSSLNEAAIALKRCMSLMTKYGITEADLTTSEFGTDYISTGKRMDQWKSYLAVGIAAFTNTIVTIEHERVNGRIIDKRIVYKGFDADVKNALLLSDYLYQTADRCVKVYKKESGNTGKAGATSFRNGFAIALQVRMVEMSKEMESEAPVTVNDNTDAPAGTSLVVCKRKMVEAEFGRQKISRARGNVSDGGARRAGNEAGQKVNLNRQVNGSNQKAIAA